MGRAGGSKNADSEGSCLSVGYCPPAPLPGSLLPGGPPPPQPLPLGRHAVWSSQLGVPGQGQDWERREGSPDPAVLQFNPGRWKRSREGDGRCGAMQPGGQCLSQSDLASRAGSATKSRAEGTLSGPQFSHLHNGNKSSAHFLG